MSLSSVNDMKYRSYMEKLDDKLPCRSSLVRPQQQMLVFLRTADKRKGCIWGKPEDECMWDLIEVCSF